MFGSEGGKGSEVVSMKIDKRMTITEFFIEGRGSRPLFKSQQSVS